MKKTKIVATLGPASRSEEVLEDLFKNGVNVCRLNFSHGTYEDHKALIDKVKKLRKNLGLPIALLLDTKGPEIRLGNFEKDQDYVIHMGDKFNLYMEERLGNEKGASVSYSKLVQDVAPGDHILIDDGLLDLRVLKVKEDRIETLALNEGLVKSHKGVNVPGAKLQLEALTQKDIEDIHFGLDQGVDFIAPSFIRKAEDVYAIRQVLEDRGDSQIKIISKIESREGVENMEEIIQASDGIMVARGDLGVEIQPEEIPLVQKKLIRECIRAAKPVITATQMLDSMIRNPRPTRAEVTDVANAILDGTSAIMLSGETASGKYPVLAVAMMNRIALRTEKYMEENQIYLDQKIHTQSTTNAIGRSTCMIAKDLGAKAILTATSSGYTSRAIAKFRPSVPIIAASPKDWVCRQGALDYGVYGIMADYEPTTDGVIATAIQRAQEEGLVKEGDLLVLTAGLPVGVSGTTNMIQVHSIAKTLARGQGIGHLKKSGRVLRVQEEKDFADFKDGDILVLNQAHKGLAAYLKRAGGLITIQGGLTSPGAILGLDLGIATIVGLKEGDQLLKTGEEITMDASTGQIFAGRVRV